MEGMYQFLTRAIGSYGTGSKEGDVAEFCKRARSILYRKYGKDKKAYEAWNAEVTELRGTGLTKNQAIVQTAKDHPCLHRLFSEYDVSSYNPTRQKVTKQDTAESLSAPEVRDSVLCKEISQSHLEDLRWAIGAAGSFLRTHVHPEECPNNGAWFLYRQAIESPKEFLSRYSQIEAKSEDEQERQRSNRHSGEQSIEEINEMLDALSLATIRRSSTTHIFRAWHAGNRPLSTFELHTLIDIVCPSFGGKEKNREAHVQN